MAQYTILRASSHQAIDHVTERGEAITLCGRRTSTTWKRIGPILNGVQAGLTHFTRNYKPPEVWWAPCFTCLGAIRKLQRDGREE